MDKYEKIDMLYEELVQIVKELKQWYIIDKIKEDAVYVYTKKGMDGLNYEDNVFDIDVDGIMFYNKNHIIPEEVMPIVEKIISKLKEIDEVRWSKE